LFELNVKDSPCIWISNLDDVNGICNSKSLMNCDNIVNDEDCIIYGNLKIIDCFFNEIDGSKGKCKPLPGICANDDDYHIINSALYIKTLFPSR
jgi:hypothetical protein